MTDTRTIELPDGWTEELRTEPETGRSHYFVLDESGAVVEVCESHRDVSYREWMAWTAWLNRETYRRASTARVELRRMEEDFNLRRSQMIEDWNADLQRRSELAAKHGVELGEAHGLEGEA